MSEDEILNLKEIKGMYGIYPLQREIGQGSTARVFKSEITKGSQKLQTVIKIIKDKIRNQDPNVVNNQNLSYFFYNEAQALYNIKSDNVIKLYDCGMNEIIREGIQKKIEFLVLEYAENNELLSYIANQKGFGELLGRTIFVQILQGLYDCHSKKIAHRDIKLDNTLLDHRFKIKIGDLGFAKQTMKELTTLCGTPRYAAPELFLKKPYDAFKTDIYSLGICLFCLVVGKYPFKTIYDPKTGFYQPYFDFTANNGDNKHVPKFWHYFTKETGQNYSDNFKSLFSLMVSLDPSRRPSTVEISNHPWVFHQPISQHELQKEFNSRKSLNDIAAQLDKIKDDDEENVKMEVYKANEASEFNFFDESSEMFENKRIFNKMTCLLIELKNESSTIKPFELMNYLAQQIEAEDKAQKNIFCNDPKMLQFNIDYLIEYKDEIKGKNYEPFKKEELVEMEEYDEDEEIPELSITLSYNVDTNLNISFIQFNKILGDTLDFYEKVERIKQIIKSSQ